MGVFDTLGKVGKTVAKGSLWYLEEQSKSVSHNKDFTDEQREGMREFSERMHDYRMNLSDREEDEEEWY